VIHRIILSFLALLVALTIPSLSRGEVPEIPANDSGDKSVYDSQALTVPLLTPEEARASFVLPDGFAVDVYASEPDVQQPVALTWDAAGRMWVAESYTYAEAKIGFDTELSDRVLIFSDTDGDGTADERKVFIDGVKRLSSVAVGLGGVWLMCSPEVLFVPDANHDDIPDGPPIVVLDGFDAGPIHHNFANGLRWGPDGWLYGRHGIQATSFVGPPGSPDHQRVLTSCSIWRYNPVTTVYEIVCDGTTNSWGMDWDADGNLFFINTVIGHLWHALPNAHLERMYGSDPNPYVYELMPQIADHVHWDEGSENWSDAKQANLSGGTDAAGGGHAHSGFMIYQDTNWPDAMRGDLFTLNFHGRRMNRDRLERRGAGFVGQHGQDSMFTSDVWFRGVELSTGPDGCVYVLDWSDIGECHENDGVHRHSGRIFRIRYGDVSGTHPDLNAFSDNELVDGLTSPSQWMARMSRRVLANRYAPKGTIQLAIAKSNSTPFNIEAKQAVLAELDRRIERSNKRSDTLEFLWTRYSLGGISWPLADRLFRSHDEVIAGWAWQLWTQQRSSQLATTRQPTKLQTADNSDATAIAPHAQELAAMAQSLTQSTTGLTRLYAAGCLSRIDQPELFWPIAQQLAGSTDLATDRDFPLMLWYSLEPQLLSNLSRSLTILSSTQLPQIRTFIARRIASEPNARETNLGLLTQIAIKTGDPTQKSQIVSGMLAGLAGLQRVEPPQEWDILAEQLEKIDDPDTQQTLSNLLILFGDGQQIETLKSIALDNSQVIEMRKSVLRTLLQADDPSVLEVAKQLIWERDLGPIAVELLAVHATQTDLAWAISVFNQLRPNAQQMLIRTLVGKKDRIPLLFEAIEQESISRDAVPAVVLRQLDLIATTDVSERLAELFPNYEPTAEAVKKKMIAVEELLLGLDLADDRGPGRQNEHVISGKKLFTERCSSCHKLFGEGNNIGPELTGAQRTNIRYFVENVVNPSAAVSDRFRIEMFVLQSGAIETGVPLVETKSTVVLQTTQKQITIAVDDIEERKQTAQSLMPTGLLDDLNPSQIQDLHSYFSSDSVPD
jgi:putative membrane-bound dehydrogenase-like protein